MLPVRTAAGCRIPSEEKNKHVELPFALDRPLIFFDLETTGLSVRDDRIIELAILRLSPQGDVLERVRRFNPGIPIHPEASAVHGIYDDDLKDEAPFTSRARALFDLLDPCDLAGFNIRRFDVPMLIAEFRRADIAFEVADRKLIDMQAIFHKQEPRDLSAAARFYLGREHQEAHTALGDIRTSAAVLAAQLERYTELPRDLGELNAYCEEAMPFRSAVDQWWDKTPNGLVFRRGKHTGTALQEVAGTAPDYLKWMLGADDMDPAVLAIVKDALTISS